MLCALLLILESPSCLLFSFLWKDAKYVSSELKEDNHSMFSQSWMKESSEVCKDVYLKTVGGKKESFQVDHSLSFVLPTSLVVY